MHASLKHILESLAVPSVEFTRMIKIFAKEYCGTADRYVLRMTDADARSVFEAVMPVWRDATVPDHAKYNALRMLKFAFSNQAVFWEIFDSVLDICRDGIVHSNGNIRMESVRILEESGFMVILIAGNYLDKSLKKSVKEAKAYFFPRLIRFHEELLARHDAYEEAHANELDEYDLVETYEGHMPFASDTRDKRLKAFRMALEAMDRGNMMEMFKEFGYEPFEDEEAIDIDDLEEIPEDYFPDPKKAEESLQFFLLVSWIPATVEDFKKQIFESQSLTHHGFREYVKFCHSLMVARGMELSQEAVAIFQDCWNVFPHRELGGKSPSEIMGE